MRIGKAFTSVVAVLLAMIIFATPVSAAGRRQKYISDVIIAYGNTYDEAVQWLKNNGWRDYVEADLNKNSSSMYDKDRAVVLGYKTTYNANEAITDLALMNMEGGYSYTSYQDMLSKKANEISSFVKEFSAALEEYRVNYAAGNQRAVVAYHLLNEFIDDDTGMKLGDLLLKPMKEEMSKTEYEALSDTKRNEHADFTTMMLQGNSIAILAIEKIVAMAADTNSDTWLDRLSKLGPDGLVDKYTEDGMTRKEAMQEIALDYSDTADKLVPIWEYLQQVITVYETSGLTAKSSDDEINAYFDKHPGIDIRDWSYVVSFYDKLSSMPYGEDGTLLDLFKLSAEEINDAEYEQLYTIASVLTPGQAATLGFISLPQLIDLGIVGNDAESWKQADKDAMEIANMVSKDEGYGAGSAEPVSVYDGIDRSIFEGDIALTNDALRKQAKTDSGIYDGHFEGINLVKLRNILFAAGLGCAVAALGINKFVIPAIKFRVASTISSGLSSFRTEMLTEYALEIIGDESYVKTNAYAWSKFATALNIASVIMCTVGLVVTVYDLIQYYNNDFTPIPDRIVDEVPVEGSYETRYVYYKVAPCNRAEKYGHDDTLGEDNDLHADLGKVWLSLYYTKDRTAGNPVTADFVVGKSNSVNGYKALHLFGEASPVNLSDPKWCYTDEFLDMFGYKDTQPIYVFYGVDTSASLVSSSFSSGLVALAIGGGIILGAGLGVLTSTVVQKRKNKENKPKAQTA